MLSTSPAIFKPFAPEFVISSVAPEFVTVPSISNIFSLLIKSASPFVLVTDPPLAIVKPSSPSLVMARLVPFEVTEPDTLSPPRWL